MVAIGDERTLVMANAVSNVRSSSPSYVALDDGALEDLETAARVVGSSSAPTDYGARSLFADPPIHPMSSASRAMGPAPARRQPRPQRIGIGAIAVGCFVALATATTLVFYFTAS